MVLLLMVFAAIFLLALFVIGFWAQEKPRREENILLSEAAALLGNAMEVVIQKQDVNRDGKPEIFAIVPMERSPDSLAPSLDSLLWVKEMAVLQRVERSSKLLIGFFSKGAAYGSQATQNQLTEEVNAPFGYRVDYFAQKNGRMAFELFVADSLGNPQSAARVFAWDPEQAAYQPVSH